MIIPAPLPDLHFGRLVPKSVAVVDEQVGSAANFDGEEASGLDSAGLHTQHQRHAGGAGDESDSGHDGMYDFKAELHLICSLESLRRRH